MLAATVGRAGEPITLLCLGAHSDDLEIGAAGTVLRLLGERPGSTVHWVVFASSATREVEARASAAELLAEARRSTIELHSYRESFFPHVAGSIKERFEQLKAAVEPDLILTHRTQDMHQDHRTVAELTWNTFRDHLVWEYEVPKYDGDLGRPNLFVPLPAAIARHKVDLILRHFRSQAERRWFRGETFESLMRLRGIECNAPDHFAEAFDVRKLVV
jgi:LmbE family N-acetylglucosaminyl deacetylase